MMIEKALGSSYRLRTAVCLLFLLSFLASEARATEGPDATPTFGGRQVAVWMPAGSAGPAPLVLFSHGLYGCKTQSSFLMRALANAGMLIVAPDHDDMASTCPDLPNKPLPDGFMDPQTWDSSFHTDRRDDLIKLLHELKSDAEYSDLIDSERVALVGHSLGGYTVLGLAGAWPD
jgi:predicted dienelactone hydrolase